MPKILIADDHPMVRRATKELILENLEDIDIIETSTAEESIILAKNANPDLIIMDIFFKDQEMDGITAIIEILKSNPKPLIIFTCF